MKRKDWSRIGPVKVRDYTGRVIHYACLDDAVRDIGHSAASNLSDRKLGGNISPYPDIRWSRCSGGDTHVIYDELDMVVPSWVIRDAVARIDWPVYRRRYDPKTFRAGPVPGVGGRYGRYMRNIATFPEHRENAGIDSDETVTDYGVRSRPSRRRGNLPSSWDDYCRNRERCWKRQRKTRWKGC